LGLYLKFGLYRISVYSGFGLYRISVYSGFSLYRISVYSGFGLYRISVYSGFGLYRISVYSGFGLYRISVYSGFGLDRFHCKCNPDSQEKFHQYQQNELPPLTSTYWTEKKHDICSWKSVLAWDRHKNVAGLNWKIRF
jgi:hypothetical protein